MASEVDNVDIRGTLETIMNLASLGMMVVDLGKYQYIPTILEVIHEYSQRLTLEYAAVEDKV